MGSLQRLERNTPENRSAISRDNVEGGTKRQERDERVLPCAGEGQEWYVDDGGEDLMVRGADTRRSATSNDPWGPTGTEMSEIAQLTFNK